MKQTIARHWLRILAHIACLAPAALLLWDFANDDLTANPIQEATLRTGKAALIILVLSLAVSPLKTLFGLKQLTPLRRPLGLYAFFYVCLHLMIFVGVDYGFDFEFIWLDVAEKRYVIAGFAAFLLLVPLAVTSTKGWMRRLGKRWKQLHALVYPVAALAVFHFVWLVKADVREPLLYGGAVALLFALRLAPVRRAINRLRQRGGQVAPAARGASAADPAPSAAQGRPGASGRPGNPGGPLGASGE